METSCIFHQIYISISHRAQEIKRNEYKIQLFHCEKAYLFFFSFSEAEELEMYEIE